MPAALAYSRASAVIDKSGRYRYSLTRLWNPDLPRAAFCLLNPSTADVERDDPTLRRCVGYARRWGFGGVEIINLFALRATDPRELRRARDPVGPRNDAAIRRAAGRAELVVAGWGNAGALHNRAERVLRILGGVGDVKSLGITGAGQPRHPLYARRDLALTPLHA